MEITSVFIVTEFKSGKQWREHIEGDGQFAMKEIRDLYPRHTKFVLEGFEIDGVFKPLILKHKYND
jgi:hypothetical protein